MKILIYSLFITQIAFSSQYPNKVVRNEAKYLRKCFSIIQKKIDNQKEENNKVNNNFNGFLKKKGQKVKMNLLMDFLM